jgi:hypothetical protein
MRGQELLILFNEDKAYLTPDKALSLQQAGLPNIGKIFNSSTGWHIVVINYYPDRKQIFAEILAYQSIETDFSEEQILIKEELSLIESIRFRTISTSKLLKSMAGDSFTPTVLEDFSETEEAELSENVSIDIEDTAKAITQKPIATHIREVRSVPINQIRFMFGGIAFDHWVNDLQKKIEIRILNENIREEFDAVKNYFANVLKTKSIQVEIHIKCNKSDIESIKASSKEIDRINKNVIDNVKFEFVKATKKKKFSSDIDKSIFTMEEYFDTYGDVNGKTNPFYKTESELIEDLLQISSTKHYKQLRYLSSKHAHKIMKLRFIHKPFSFIFLIEGEKHYHIVWETLDTEEATYVWYVDKDLVLLKQTLYKIQDIINVIKVQGKTAYINTSQDSFRRIYHDYSDIVDGFVKWKGELEAYLS